MPNGKAAKGAGVSNGNGLKGGVLSPEQPSTVPDASLVAQPAISQDVEPVAPEPTSGIVVMVTQEKYQKLTQGKSYKQTPLIPQATPAVEPVPVIPQGKDPKSAPVPTPEPAPAGPSADLTGSVPQENLAPEPELPQGKYQKPQSGAAQQTIDCTN